MKAIIFGGGKIARGFIAHLLYLSGASIVFVDVNKELIQLMGLRGQYNVSIMGAEHKNTVIKGFKSLLLTDFENIAEEWLDADVAFTSVGGKNLPALGQALAEIFRLRCEKAPWARPFNIITCENWKEPARLLTEEIRTRLSNEHSVQFDRWVGVTEAVVMRSAVEPALEMLDKDPLCVCVQDFWELPVDRERIKGESLSIEGVKYISNFFGFLERKFYTYNAANGTVSYLGYLKKHSFIYEAASDSEIIEILDRVYLETSQALAKKHGVSLEDQLVFAASSKKKLQDRNIIDYVERNARDPIRKLGPDDRLVGSARLVQENDIVPEGLATAVAAALYYDHPADPIAQELRTMREREGIDALLLNICQIPPTDPLSILVKQKVELLKQKGWIC